MSGSHKGELLAATFASQLRLHLINPWYSAISWLQPGQQRGEKWRVHGIGAFLCALVPLLPPQINKELLLNQFKLCLYKSQQQLLVWVTLLTTCINSVSERLKSSTAIRIKMIPLCSRVWSRTVKMTRSCLAQHRFKSISDSRLAPTFPNTPAPPFLLSPTRTPLSPTRT